jgi:long-chain alkane monooxygenase
LGGPGLLIMGSADQAADELRALAHDTGVDGFNVSYAITPGSVEELVELVILCCRSWRAWCSPASRC